MLLKELEKGVLRTIEVPLDSVDDTVHVRQLSYAAMKEIRDIEDKDKQAVEMLLRTITDEENTQLTVDMLDEIKENNSTEIQNDLFKAFAKVNGIGESLEGED